MLAMSRSVQISEFARWLDRDDDPVRNQRRMGRSDQPLVLDHLLRPQYSRDQYSSTGTIEASMNNDPKAAKKLSHNANERDRRRRINHLFSCLRSLLPLEPHHRKKLSVPETITHVLEYIPELQHVVQRLTRRKERLATRQKLARSSGGKLSSVRATRLGNGDVSVEMCAEGSAMISVALVAVEQDGLVLVNASSFQACGGRPSFYTLHFKVGQNCKLECEALTKKLLSL